ncbi:MAG TPA: acylphosphatase [Candidatus Bathyarchaeia archaeon]
MRVGAHVTVSGKVQGVFFRSKTKHEADRYAVKGWVRNLDDGKVEAVFEGEEDAVKAMVEFCKRGPVGARVTKTDVFWKSYTGEFAEFDIRYKKSSK